MNGKQAMTLSPFSSGKWEAMGGLGSGPRLVHVQSFFSS